MDLLESGETGKHTCKRIRSPPSVVLLPKKHAGYCRNGWEPIPPFVPFTLHNFGEQPIESDNGGTLLSRPSDPAMATIIIRFVRHGLLCRTNGLSVFRGGVGQKRQIREPMLAIARGVDADIESQIAAGFPLAESPEQILECLVYRTIHSIEDVRVCLFSLFCCQPSICRVAFVRRAIVVFQLQAEPNIADEGPVSPNHGRELGEAGWRQSEASEIQPLDFGLPLSGYCDDAARRVTIVHQAFQDEQLDFLR